jgi:hypothetical protein
MPAGYPAALMAQLRVDALALTGTSPRQRAEVVAAVAALEEPAPAPAIAVIPLEEWVAAEGIDPDFYTQAELVELYREANPSHVPGRVSALQIEPRSSAGDQLSALRALETLMARAPSPGDQLDAWLEPRLVARIGGGTVEALSRAIISEGRSWVRSFRGVGITQARLIAEWLDASLSGGHAEALKLRGRPGRRRASHARPTLATLARRFGAATSSLDADAAEVEAYLLSRGRAVRQDVERFFVWMSAVDRRPLDEATDETVVRYLAWAGALGDSDIGWVAGTPREHRDPRWAPFRKPLSKSAATKAEVRVRALLKKVRRLKAYRSKKNDRANAISACPV